MIAKNRFKVIPIECKQQIIVKDSFKVIPRECGWQMMDKNSFKVIPKVCGHGDPLVRVLPAKSQTWRGDKTNRQFEEKLKSPKEKSKK